MDSLIAKYLNVLNENIDKSGVVKNAVPRPGAEAFGDLKAEDAKKQSKNVDIETPEEDKDNSCEECDGEPEKLKTKVESANPFDELYNKILKEESFGWALDEEEPMDEEENTFGADLEENEGDEENEGEGMQEVLSHLKSAVSALEKLLEQADKEEENEDEEGEEEENEGEEVKEEAVEAETLGHALVDQEKLTGGLTSKNNVVKAGVSPVKKKAEVPSTNKGHDGEAKKENESAGKQLTGKNNKVDGVKVGNLFNNK